MKLAPVLLAVSLAANVALLVAWKFTRVETPAAVPDSATNAAASVAESGDARGATAKSPVPASPSVRPPPTGKTWARLGSEDIPSLIVRLRAAGCPPDVLRAIVAQRFELRREELTLDGNDVPFWKRPPDTPPDPAVVEALAKLQREMRATMLELGPENEDTDLWRVLRNRRFGSLSDEKASQLEALESRRSEEISRLARAAPNGVLQMEQVRGAEQQMLAEIAKVLTPEELAEYELRNGSSSSRLRSALVGFNATEAEYRALFQFYREQDAQFPLSPTSTPAERAARATAQQQMDAQIKAVLGPDRFAQYQQASQPEYQQLNRLVTRLELPLSAAAQVAAVQREIQGRANAVRMNRELTPEARAEQLAVLSEDATKRITAAIGPRGLEGYRQYGGAWLQQLQPRPANPKGKTR